MNTNDEGAKQSIDARSIARSVLMIVLATAVEAASGVLKESVTGGVPVVMHALFATLMRMIWSSAVKVQTNSSLKETIDV